MILARSLKSITAQTFNILFKLQKVLIGIAVIGLGVSLGYLFNSPGTAQLTIAIVTVFTVMLMIAHKPLHGILLWLMLEPFINNSVKISLGAGIPDLSFTRFTIAFLAIFMLAKAAAGKLHFARIGLAEICILATPLGIMAAAPLSVDPKAEVQTAISMHFAPLAVYFFAKNLVQDKKDLHKIFWALAILGFVSGAYAAYEHATGNVLFLYREEDDFFREALGIRKIRGIYGGPGKMGRALAAAIPVTLYLFLEHKRIDVKKFLLAGMLVVESYGIFIAMSRTPWYALLIALVVMQFFYPQFRKMFYVIVLVAAVVLWATWDQVAESDAARRVDDKLSTMEKRELRWQTGFNMWLAKPIRGWGFGRFRTESGRFRTDGERGNMGNIENDYLLILDGSGLIGFLPYLLFLLAPLVNSLRLFFRARAPDWSGFIKVETLTVYWAVILGFLITSYTMIHTHPTNKLIIFAVAGAVVGTHEHCLRGSKARKRSASALLSATVMAEKGES